MVIRMRYSKQGGHYHVRVFTAPAPDQTFAKCGELCFDEREWPEVREKLGRGAELINETPKGG